MSFEMRSAGGLTCGLGGCLAPCVVSALLLGTSAPGPRGPSPAWAGGPLACPFPHAPESGAVGRGPPGPGEGSASFLSRGISPNKGNNPRVAFLFFSGMFHAMATLHPLSVILPVSDGAPAQSGESTVTHVAPAPAPSSSPRVPGLRKWSFSNCIQGSRVNCFLRLLGAPHKSLKVCVCRAWGWGRVGASDWSGCPVREGLHLGGGLAVLSWASLDRGHEPGCGTLGDSWWRGRKPRGASQPPEKRSTSPVLTQSPAHLSSALASSALASSRGQDCVLLR